VAMVKFGGLPESTEASPGTTSNVLGREPILRKEQLGG